MGMTDGLQQNFPFGQSLLLIPLALEGHTGARPQGYAKVTIAGERENVFRRGVRLTGEMGLITQPAPPIRKYNKGSQFAVFERSISLSSAVQEGKLTLADRALLPEWRGDADPRRNIRLDQLLRMTSLRLGITREEGVWDHARDLAPIVRAFPPRLPGT